MFLKSFWFILFLINSINGFQQVTNKNTIHIHTRKNIVRMIVNDKDFSFSKELQFIQNSKFIFT
jgi:hypothetical protein